MDTIIDLFEQSCSKYPDNPYLWEKIGGKYEAMTYARTRQRVREIAGGLLYAGLKKGQRVALLAEGCADWVCCELGIFYAGGINVPLSIRLNEQELIFRLNHAGCRFLIVSAYYMQTVARIIGELETVEKIYVFSSETGEDKRYVPLESLAESGREWLEHNSRNLDEVLSSVSADQVANIIYTSGTTAEPKGIMLTHGNFVSNVLQSDSLIQIPQHYRILLFLPWDHSFAHTVGLYSFMYNGASVAAVDFGRSPMESLRNIPVNIREIKPHILLSVPAIAKNFRKNIETEIGKKGVLARTLYRWGLKLAYRYYGEQRNGPKGWRYLLCPLVRFLMCWYLIESRKVFGGNLRFFIGGGALLDVELQNYFSALGIPMYQGYGLSEASPVISSNTPLKHKFGSSGVPVRPMALKILNEQGKEAEPEEAGEIVISGGNVMKGYWRNEESTAKAVRDGWLYTGDLGYMGKDGFLYVLGRFKSLLIANDGEKYSPEGIEEAIVEKSAYIDACVLYNNQSSYTSGLIVPNKQALKEYVERKKAEWGTVESYKLMLQKIHKELMEFRRGGKYEGLFPERWLPAVVAILPERLKESDGTINSSSKMVRHRVIELYKKELDYVYTPEGKDIQNVRNTQNIRKLFKE